jgi:hypothetical protein
MNNFKDPENTAFCFSVVCDLIFLRSLFTFPCASNYLSMRPTPLEVHSPKTHSKRKATQHGCLPILLGEGDKGIEIVYGEEKNILYWADYIVARCWTKPDTTGPTNQPRKDPPFLSFVLFESPIASVFSRQQGPLSIVYLALTLQIPLIKSTEPRDSSDLFCHK